MKILLPDSKWTLRRKIGIGLVSGILSLFLVWACFTIVAKLVGLIFGFPHHRKPNVIWLVPPKK